MHGRRRNERRRAEWWLTADAAVVRVKAERRLKTRVSRGS
jgi:hypothetical protein